MTQNTAATVATWTQIAAWLAAIVGGLVAAFRAIDELRQNRRARLEELRWKKAQLARDVLTGFSNDRRYRDALTMLDWTGRDFESSPGHFESITWGQMAVALRPDDNTTFDSKEVYVRDCFDTLLSAFELLEHYLRTDLLEFADVAFPLQYSVSQLYEPRIEVSIFGFMRRYGYDLALAFLERFPRREPFPVSR